ncbi:type II toxin-antitoxin system VapC family toxin [bacterium]|nr:type II toxin-antitoxin system VapC family toxin [bacterium]
MWIALASARDQHYRAADAALREAIAAHTPLLTTSLILAEVHRFLLFHAGIHAAAVMLERIAASPSVAIVYPGAEHDAAARQWLARLDDQRITLTDAVSFAVMQSHRCAAALSFDRDFAIAGFAIRP